MIEAYFKETNRKFYKLQDLKNSFPDWKEELTDLYKQGKIIKHSGQNGITIEVI